MPKRPEPSVKSPHYPLLKVRKEQADTNKQTNKQTNKEEFRLLSQVIQPYDDKSNKSLLPKTN
jgi:hypothetical protein